MNDEIKIKYIFKNVKTGKIRQLRTTVESIEGQPGLASPHAIEILLSRCLCIGLKDKNRKDMYHHDIIVIPGSMPINHPNYEDEIVEVVWDTGSWAYKYESGMVDHIYALIGNGMEEDDDAEIIGNTFCNQELFEVRP